MSTHLSILELPSLSLFPLLKGKSCIISRYLYILPLNSSDYYLVCPRRTKMSLLVSSTNLFLLLVMLEFMKSKYNSSSLALNILEDYHYFGFPSPSFLQSYWLQYVSSKWTYFSRYFLI